MGVVVNDVQCEHTTLLLSSRTVADSGSDTVRGAALVEHADEACTMRKRPRTSTTSEICVWREQVQSKTCVFVRGWVVHRKQRRLKRSLRVCKRVRVFDVTDEGTYGAHS
jgi:hypothetical protein